MAFDEWMERINGLFMDAFLVGYSDFEDWTWMEAYDLGKTPRQAFEKWAEEISHSEFI